MYEVFGCPFLAFNLFIKPQSKVLNVSMFMKLRKDGNNAWFSHPMIRKEPTSKSTPLHQIRHVGKISFLLYSKSNINLNKRS